MLRFAAALISVSLASEPVVGLTTTYPVTQGHCDNRGIHRIPSPGYPRYPFTDQPRREDEQLGWLVVGCPRRDSNPGPQFLMLTC